MASLEPSDPFQGLRLCPQNSVSRKQRLWFEETQFENVRLLSRKAKHLVLAGPFGRQVGKAGYTRTVGQPPLDGRSDESRRQECTSTFGISSMRST
jgi:hypothetical protein